MLIPVAILSADVDSVREKLDKAKASYESAEVKYRLAVFDWFDKQEAAARSKGNKTGVDNLKAEREAFEQKGELPKSARSRFKVQLSKPRAVLEREYETAIRGYTKANLDSEAAAVEKELAALKANALSSGLPPDDAVSFGGKHYKVFDRTLTWQAAKAECEEMGGRLAIITSLKENEFVRGLAVKSNVKVIWLGATDEKQEGNWRWVDGSDAKFSNWDTSLKQPNNAQSIEHYVVLLAGKQGLWWDYPAHPKDFPKLAVQGLPGFVCEWD